MAPREQLQREIERLEGQLSGTRVSNELATVRRGLGSSEPPRAPSITLPNLRIGFKCKERWEDMVGDDRVRACGGCDRPVFNLSEMTRAEAEAVLATRGLTPCVRFYRRPDGTVMTNDCPTGVRPGPRRLAVLAAGTALAASPAAMADSWTAADPTAADDPSAAGSADTQSTTPADTDTTDAADPSASITPAEPPIEIDHTYMTMGVPVHSYDYEMGDIDVGDGEGRPRPAVEWSVWTRLGYGVATQRFDVAARSITPPMPVVVPVPGWEAALAADLSFRMGNGDLRLGVFGELRTSSDAVAGGELILEGLPPHPYSSRIGGSGNLVIRVGGNDRILTGAVGFGYVGSYPRSDPWIEWARHMVGARMVFSFNRAIDDPDDWSATLGVEFEPIGFARAMLELATGED